jgi:hypothetical protein
MFARERPPVPRGGGKVGEALDQNGSDERGGDVEPGKGYCHPP